MLGKRKEKLIRDIAAMVFVAIDEAVVWIARPYRKALEREEVERIAAIVVEAIKADLPSDGLVEPEPVEPEPLVDPRFDKRFRNQITGVIGRLIIERNGPKNTQFRLIAYLGSGTDDFHVFRRGIMVECEAAWPKACEWMEERFPDPPSDESVESETVDTKCYNAYFGETNEEIIEVGLVTQLLIDRTGPGDRQFRLIAYPPSENGPSPYVFTQGTESDCKAAWDDAVEWMTKKFPKNKA